jgi:hypothetical protein
MQAFLIIAVISSFALPSNPVYADSWYNASWDYRKEITVTDEVNDGVVWQLISKTDAATGEDVDCEGHCQDDFDDLRFTKSDGTTLLDYYIETVVDSGGTKLATVAIEQASTAESTIYMYYGNAGASAVSNGADTFEQFEDFEWGVDTDSLDDDGGSVDWTTTAAGSSKAEIDTAQKYGGTRSGRLYRDGTNSPIASFPQTAGVGYAIRFRVRKNDTAYYAIMHGNGTKSIWFVLYTDEKIEYYDGGFNDTGQVVTTDTWALFELTNINHAVGTYDIWFNGSLIKSGATMATNAGYANIISQGTYIGTAETDIDNIIVYKVCTTTFAYGVEEEAPTVPALTTSDATDIEETTVTLGGNITDVTGGNATVRGIEYDIDSGAPYANDWHENGDFGTGAYTHGITGLTKGELYYYRAYATNVAGTGYGSEKTFLTKPDEPNTFVATAAGETDIDLTWIKGTGADNTYIRGKQGSYPTDKADGTLIYNDTGTSTTHSGLATGQHWYYRAWSWCTEGALEQYSDLYDEADATTTELCEVTTGSCVGFDSTWAITTGTLIDDQEDDVTEYGFDYGLTDAVPSSITAYRDLSNDDSFSLKISDLSPATVYYYRAKAYNSSGWGYGDIERLATSGSPAIYEYYITGGNDDSADIYGQNWTYQLFNSDNVTAHTVTSIRLYLKRTLAPGDITVSLRHATDTEPTGLDLVSAVVDGDTISTDYNWVEFSVDEYSLLANTNYAIVVRCLNSDNSNYINWQINNAGGYADGLYGTSADGGVTWTDTEDDAIFELWGNPCIDIDDVKVFTGYQEDGDWLIVFRYINTYPPYYDTDDIKRLFVSQFVSTDDTEEVYAQSLIPAWGNRIGSIYLSADSVTSLDYGGDYSVIMYGLFGDNPYVQYDIEDEDWIGSDLTQLQSWVLSSTAVISTYYNTDLTTYIAGRGECLNATGGSICEAGITGCSRVCPNLFETYTQPGNYDPETWNQSYRISLSNWQANVGADTTAAMTRIGNLFGVGGDAVIIFIMVLAMILLAVLAFPAGHTTAALVLSCGFLFVGVGFGLDIKWIAVLALVAAFLFVKQVWWNTGA